MIYCICQDDAPLKSLNKLLVYSEKPKRGNLKLKMTSKE